MHFRHFSRKFDKEKSSTPCPATSVTAAGSGEYGKVMGLDASGARTVQGGGGAVVHNNVGANEEDEGPAKATWTRKTIDSVEVREADGNQPHLLSRADWSTSLLTVLSRARELGHSIGMEAADIAQLGAQIVERQSGKIINDAELLQIFGKLTKESKAAALQQKSTSQAQPAQSSVVVGAGGGREEGLAYSGAEAQHEAPSDTPWPLTLTEKALMVVRPTEKGDSIAELDIWCHIVRDKEVERNKNWKTPRLLRFQATPSCSLCSTQLRKSKKRSSRLAVTSRGNFWDRRMWEPPLFSYILQRSRLVA